MNAAEQQQGNDAKVYMIAFSDILLLVLIVYSLYLVIKKWCKKQAPYIPRQVHIETVGKYVTEFLTFPAQIMAQERKEQVDVLFISRKL